MAQKVSIGVDAQLDTAAVEQKINALGRKVAEANKVQFNPVSVKSIDQVAKLEKQFQQLLKVHGELNRRMKATGQAGRGLAGTDFDQIYPDQHVRGRQLQRIMEYTLGSGAFSARPTVPGGGGGAPPAPHPGRPRPPGAPGIVMPAVNAGLNAMGPAGGVASGALNTGMSAGFGAGLMGLLGGMLALGVGKIVGGIGEKINQAEDNNVALDRLKRTLGDVNVSFDGLKAVINDGAEAMKITYAEAGKLGMQFAKLGNVKAGQYTSLADELGVGVGMSRAFGLDPSEGVGVMGQMRGIGVTKDVQDSKRFALLIGETIAKSDAFAKADEVIGAIGSFAVNQTRNNVGAANVSGYAGAFSALVGSGLPGLDPSGAAALLARINSSLSGGGAKGEASQYFTGILGTRMGLNPYQTRMFREGGAFATADSMFGEGSAYAKYKGRTGPRGSATMLEMTLGQLRQQYGAGSDELADATANHLGVGINQAMALLSIKPNQMGQMSKYADLTSLTGAGIGNLSKVLFGSAGDRQGVADSLMRRNDLSADEKNRLSSAMAGGDEQTQKQVLAELVASRDQEQTTGKDVRDSKNALDNIKTSIADKLVPYLNEARMGIMSIAGVGKGKTTDQIMREVIEADSKGRRDAINGRFAPEIGTLLERQDHLERKRDSLDPAKLAFAYRDKPEVLAAKLKERTEVEAELTRIGKRLKEIEDEKAILIERENAARKKEIADLEEQAMKRTMAAIETTGSVMAPGFHPLGTGGAGAGRGAGADLRRMDYGPVDEGRKNEAMQYFMSQGWSKEQAAGLVANLWAESKMRERAVGDGGAAVGIAQWHPDRQAAFQRQFGKKLQDASFQEQLQFVQYELTQGGEQAAGDRLRSAKTAYQAGDAGSRYYERPAATDSEARSRGQLAEGVAGGYIQVEIVHKNEKGQEVAPRQVAKTRVQSNWAMGPR